MIRATFNMRDVQRVHAAELARVHRLIFDNLEFIGLEATALARKHTPQDGSYMDDTGNLRSSVGYAIGRNGHVVDSGGFEGTATGTNTGRAFAESLIAGTRGFALAVVAGMHYGVYVEKRQYDVLTFTEANARITASKLFQSMFG